MTRLQPPNVWLAVFGLTLLTPGTVPAQVEVMTNDRPVHVFAGDNRTLAVAFRNGPRQEFNADISMRLLQTSSATAVPVSMSPWKRLRLLADQTVLESATLNFPEVRSATRFLVQWLEGTNHVLGSTVVLVYPTNLLTQLRSLAGGDPIGVFDPANQLKPLLRAQATAFEDLQEEGTERYAGRLAIFGPGECGSRLRPSLKDEIRSLAQRGVAVVWLQPQDPRALLKPSFHVVREGAAAVVVASPEMVASLAERPEAQLILLKLVEHALHPAEFTLPETGTSN